MKCTSAEIRFFSSHIMHFTRSLSFDDDVYAHFVLALLRLAKNLVAWRIVPSILEASSHSSFCVEGTSGCFSRYSVLKKTPLKLLCDQNFVVLFSDSQETWLSTVLNVWFFFSLLSAWLQTFVWKFYENYHVLRIVFHRIGSISDKPNAHDNTHEFD